jgi:hypothetical protein
MGKLVVVNFSSFSVANNQQIGGIMRRRKGWIIYRNLQMSL